MTTNPAQDRNGRLGEYLEHLQSMAQELERSMEAIAANTLTPLEESIANQQAIAIRLRELARDLSKPAEGEPAAAAPTDESLMLQIRDAAERLKNLNKKYSALLKLSTHSVGLMISLYTSSKGQMKENVGPALKRQTWSCEA
jgi:hypothetical protein